MVINQTKQRHFGPMLCQEAGSNNTLLASSWSGSSEPKLAFGGTLQCTLQAWQHSLRHSEDFVLILFIYLFTSPCESSGWRGYCQSLFMDSTVSQKHYKEENLFWEFNCRLSIRTLQKGGRKTGKTTQCMQCLRQCASTPGQAMEIAAASLAHSRPCHKGYVPHMQTWDRAGKVFPWLCGLLAFSSQWSIRDARLAGEWETWAEAERSRRSKVLLVPPINLCLHFSNVLSLRDKVIW